METFFIQILTSIVSAIIGGVITGVAAFSAIRVEMKYLRRDIDHAHARMDEFIHRH